MKTWGRRTFLHQARRAIVGSALLALCACKERIVQIEKIIEVPRVVTKVVTEVVRETVIVERVSTSPAPSRVSEKAISPVPAARTPMAVVADVLSYGWTRWAIKMTASFEEMFPQIRMNWRSLSDWRDYPQRIASLHASDELGDLIEAPLGIMPRLWAQSDVTRSLDDLMTADALDSRSIFRGALDACTLSGAQVALPYLCSGGENVLLYNRAVFDRAKVAYPTSDWNLDDLTRAGRALIQASQEQPRLFAYAPRYELPEGYPLLSVFGIRMFSADGRACTLSGSNTLDCLRWGLEQIFGHGIAPRPSQVERGALEMLTLGRLAMVGHGLRTLVQLGALQGERAPFAGVPLPRHPTSGLASTHLTGMAYCIPRHSKASIESFQWIKFMAGREIGVQMFLEGYAEPGCRTVSWKDPRVLAMAPLCAPLADGLAVARAEIVPWNLRISDCLETWNANLTRLWRREQTPEQSVAQMTSSIERILSEPMLALG